MRTILKGLTAPARSLIAAAWQAMKGRRHPVASGRAEGCYHGITRHDPDWEV